MAMKIEVWSDYACPYCYVGKRGLSLALEEFEHKDKTEVTFRAFELDPSAPKEVITTIPDKFAKKYGKSLEETMQIISRMEKYAKEVGIDMHYETAKSSNTFDAHRLTKFAESKNLGLQMTEQLFKGYFVDNIVLADHSSLTKAAKDTGLDETEVKAVLESDQYAAEVRRDEMQANRAGIHAVPFFLINGRYAVSGAQPKEELLSTLQQVWSTMFYDRMQGT
ncbi:DsbA family oxidoreductase [Dipodascopsis uninucleata]